jgi:crotonobetainyl-CoA:carnitine CoA-transferase CaiB-like acyl-CoA transferase
MPTMSPLKGAKVIDLSKVLAGPLCGQFLGELGADVIKIEPTGSGDDTRSWLPQDQEQSATFLAVNHNKRSLAVDLKSSEGQAIVHQLVNDADIVLQGFGGGTAERLKVDYATLSRINPRLIYCEISGYGGTGPLGGSPGYDVMLQAFSGMISSMGDPAGGLARASFSPVDLGTGMHALSGVLAAYIERLKTGNGAHVEVTLLDTAVGLMAYHAQNYWRASLVPKRMGTGHPALCPYQAFDSEDGPIMIGVGNDAQWRRFCEIAGLEEAASAPRFATNKARVMNFDETVALVAARVKQNTRAYWLNLLPTEKIPCSPIHTLPEALAHPQVVERGLVVESNHPVLGKIKTFALPVRFNGQSRKVVRPAPLLGEHSEEVLREMGFDAEQIGRWAKDKVVEVARSSLETP